MYRFTDGGLRNVWLSNGYIVHHTKYGNGVSFQNLDGLTQVICRTLAVKPGKLTGAEFRYIRSNMLLSPKSLSGMLGCTEKVVLEWEKSGKIPKAVEYFARQMYLETNTGKSKVGSMKDVLNLIDRVANIKIIIEKSSNWTSKIEVSEI